MVIQTVLAALNNGIVIFLPQTVELFGRVGGVGIGFFLLDRCADTVIKMFGNRQRILDFRRNLYNTVIAYGIVRAGNTFSRTAVDGTVQSKAESIRAVFSNGFLHQYIHVAVTIGIGGNSSTICRIGICIVGAVLFGQALDQNREFLLCIADLISVVGRNGKRAVSISIGMSRCRDKEAYRLER